MDFASILPVFGNFAFTVAAFIVALSVIVAIHEYGHYIVGRWTGIHAEVFSLGFGPTLWSRVDKRGTKWQIAALPFGGYVKFLGDADAASGKDGEAISSLSEEERRHTMHGAPLWARFLTVLAGPVFNFILAIIVFAGLALVDGISTYPPKIATVYELPAGVSELEPGDTLVAIEGVRFPDEEGYGAFLDALPSKPKLSYTVLRDGEEVTVSGPPLSPTRVNAVTPGWAADKAGIQVDDVILEIGGTKVYEFGQMIPLINDSAGKPTVIKLWRDGKVLDYTIEAQKRDLPIADNQFETRYIMGISGSLFFESARERPGIGEALKIGVTGTWGVITQSISGLTHMIAGKISSCNLSGPVGIANISGELARQGVLAFLYFIAMLSTAIGLMNLFPVPVLDGGHLVFYTYEAIAGKPPSDKVLNILMTAGFAMILMLMGFALYNDFMCP